MGKFRIIDSGLINYQDGINLQKKIVQERLCEKIPDVLILCEHYPVITLGCKSSGKDLLVSDQFLREKGVEIYKTERGGEATYHCIGQLICYPIFDLHNYDMDLHKFLRNIEEVIISTIFEIGIEGKRREGYTGVWVSDDSGFEKIAFIGIACRKWVTFHGFSLNIDCDLTPFSWIVPCGLEGVKITSVKNFHNGEADKGFTVNDIKPKVIENFRRIFEYEKEISALA